MGIDKSTSPAIIPSPKIYYLDHVKLLLTVLVILHHAFVAYGSLGGWYYKQPATDLKVVLPLTVLISTDQSFFMGLFFLLSAYFIEPSLKRKGVKFYLKDRFKRLGIPLLFYSFLLSPIVKYLVYHYGMLKKGTLVQYLSSGNNWIDLGALWFVAALLLFTPVFVLMYHLKLTGNGSIYKLRASYVLLFAAGLGYVTFFVRIPFHTDWALKPVGFILGQFPQYIAMFVIGIMARRGKLEENLDLKMAERFAWLSAAILIIGFPLMCYVKIITSSPVSNFYGGMNLESLIYSFYEQIIGICIMVALTGISKYKWGRSSTNLSTLSRNSFAVYIIHPFVLVCISLVLSRFYTTPTIKLVIAAPAAVTGSFLLAAGIMRIPGVNKVI